LEYKQESVFTRKVNGGHKRIYFIDVKKSRSDDYYIVLTESAKRRDGRGFDRHKIFLYKEDLNRFLSGITEAVDEVKKLMPDFDFNKFDRRNEESDDSNESNDNSDERTDEPKNSDEMSW
jgi:hypothetical protein